jgi:hypothetical protein
MVKIKKKVFSTAKINYATYNEDKNRFSSPKITK